MPLEAPSPLKLPPHRGEGGLGGGVGERLREIYKGGAKFTTDSQDTPIFSNIDRAFMSTDWKAKFPFMFFNHYD